MEKDSTAALLTQFLPGVPTHLGQNPGMVSLMEILLESDCRVVFTLLSVVDLAFNQSIPEAIIRIHEVGGAPTVLIKSAITLDLSSTSPSFLTFLSSSGIWWGGDVECETRVGSRRA